MQQHASEVFVSSLALTSFSVEMEANEAEKIVIARPVASRPSSSSFRSFSELLASAINASPSNACPAIAVTAIRPKTLRLKPVLDHISAEVVPSQTQIDAAVCIPSDMVLKSDSKSDVVYKPMAKLPSRTTVSGLANPEVAEIGAHVQQPNEVTSLPKSASIYNQSSHVQSEEKKPMECSKLTAENLEEYQKSLLQTNTADRLAYDGYNWRKYGQKQVKGSEYPRSYYKCTHPNCPVKKNVERSLDGQIAEIVYKGEHNHSKPQPLQRGSSGRQELGFVSDARGNETNNLPWNNQLSERNGGYEDKIENENEVGSSGHSTHSNSTPSFCDSMMAGVFLTGASAADNSCGLSEECDVVSKDLEAEGDGPRGKRRRIVNQLDAVDTSGESAKEPLVVGQNPSDSEILGDGFHWRKYGQKIVKGNPYPRSYYRCTSPKCNVRKYVERTSDAPGAFITTYEGRHNHDMPIKSTNLVASKTNTKTFCTKEQ